MSKIAGLIAIATAVSIATSASASDRVQAGEWETTLKLAGGASMTPAKYCISAAEAKAMNGDAATVRAWVVKATSEKTSGRCALTKFELAGNRVVATVSCGKAEVVSTTNYFGDRYESSTSDGTTIKGRRLGACPGK